MKELWKKKKIPLGGGGREEMGGRVARRRKLKKSLKIILKYRKKITMFCSVIIPDVFSKNIYFLTAMLSGNPDRSREINQEFLLLSPSSSSGLVEECSHRWRDERRNRVK